MIALFFYKKFMKCRLFRTYSRCKIVCSVLYSNTNISSLYEVIRMRPKNNETKVQIYEFINEYIKEYRISPSVREIAKEVKCSISTVHKFLVRLEEEGLIERSGKRHITSSVNSWSMDCAPIVGMVACGQPITAIENIQGYLPINKEYFGAGDYVALIAEGNSMINVGIDSGDLVIVRRQNTAQDGQIVVAMVQNEYDSECSATLKRFYHTDERNVFRLHPENAEMEDIIVNNVEIIGVAVKVLKDLK